MKGKILLWLVIRPWVVSKDFERDFDDFIVKLDSLADRTDTSIDDNFVAMFAKHKSVIIELLRSFVK